MKPSGGEIGPIHVLAEFVCQAIPAAAVKRSVVATNRNPKKKTGKPRRTSKSTHPAPDGKSKTKNEKPAKPKSSRKKPRSA